MFLSLDGLHFLLRSCCVLSYHRLVGVPFAQAGRRHTAVGKSMAGAGGASGRDGQSSEGLTMLLCY